jgi:hypothetical protein
MEFGRPIAAIVSCRSDIHLPDRLRFFCSGVGILDNNYDNCCKTQHHRCKQQPESAKRLVHKYIPVRVAVRDVLPIATYALSILTTLFTPCYSCVQGKLPGLNSQARLAIARLVQATSVMCYSTASRSTLDVYPCN